MVQFNSFGGRSGVLMAQNLALFALLCIVVVGLVGRTNAFAGITFPSFPGMAQADETSSLGAMKDGPAPLARVARLAPELHLHLRQARQAGPGADGEGSPEDAPEDTCVEGELCGSAGEGADVDPSTTAAGDPSDAATTAAAPPATTDATETATAADTVTYVLPDHPDFPVCTADEKNSPAQQLRNKLTKQCLAQRSSGRLGNTDCGDSNTLWLCVDPATGVVRTPDSQCLGTADMDAAYEPGYLELVPCTQQVGYWRVHEDGRVINTDTDFCMDARHNHLYADIIQYECKDDDGYKPKNQMWQWYA